jgi:hypothetical protein
MAKKTTRVTSGARSGPPRTVDLFGVTGPDVAKLKKAALAMEDVLIFSRQLKSDSLASAIDTIHSILAAKDGGISSSAVARTYQSADPNKHFLIGALPRLLLDRNLFPSNDDIVDFATSALRLEMKVEKRARFEIIGKIVCETDGLDEKQLTDLVRALERLVGDEATIADMVLRKKSGSFSWNETLQELLKQ